MYAGNTLFLVMAGCLLAFAASVEGQEVFSDVKIPLPSELVTGVPAVTGRGVGPIFIVAPQGPIAFQNLISQVALGTLNEGGTREQVGDFMASLLIKAGVIGFDPPPAADESTAHSP